MRGRWAALAVAGAVSAGGVGWLAPLPAFTEAFGANAQRIDIPCTLYAGDIPVPDSCMVDTGTPFEMMLPPALAAFLGAKPVGAPVDALTVLGPKSMQRVGVRVDVDGKDYEVAATVTDYWTGGPVLGIGLLSRLGAMSVDWSAHTITFADAQTLDGRPAAQSAATGGITDWQKAWLRAHQP